MLGWRGVGFSVVNVQKLGSTASVRVWAHDFDTAERELRVACAKLFPNRTMTAIRLHDTGKGRFEGHVTVSQDRDAEPSDLS